MLDLDNESKIWCFVCSLRCLIYKVHAAYSSSLMLSLFKLFVKNFFQVFSNFFEALSFKKLYSVLTERCVGCRSRKRLRNNTRAPCICQQISTGKTAQISTLISHIPLCTPVSSPVFHIIGNTFPRIP